MSNANKTREATLKLVETTYDSEGKHINLAVWTVEISTKFIKDKIHARIVIKNPNYNDKRHVWIVQNYEQFIGMDDVAELCASFIFNNIISYVQKEYHLQHNTFEFTYNSWDNTKTCTWYVEPFMDEAGEIRHFAVMKEVSNLNGDNYEE